VAEEVCSESGVMPSSSSAETRSARESYSSEGEKLLGLPCVRARGDAGPGNSRQGKIGEVRPCGRARVGLDPGGLRIFGRAARTTAADRSEHAAGPDRARRGSQQLRVCGGGSGLLFGSVWIER
jgi:hypothetical protein